MKAAGGKAPKGKLIARYGGMLAAGLSVAHPVTAMVRGAVSYRVPFGETPVAGTSSKDGMRFSLNPIHITYTQGEYYAPDWSVGPVRRMRTFIEAGGPKELGKYVGGKGYIANVEDAAIRAAVSKSKAARQIKQGALRSGVSLPDHEVIDLTRRVITAKSMPERLKPFVLPNEVHVGHIEVAGRREPSYLVVHPGVTKKPILLEAYLRGRKDAKELNAVGSKLDTLLDAYHASAPELFGNFLNRARPERSRLFHSWGKKMKAYSDFGSRNVGVVETPAGPELKIINPLVLAYSPAKLGVGPFLAARYGHVDEMGYVFRRGSEGRYEHVPTQGSVPGEGFGLLQGWAKKMRDGENPLLREDSMIRFHEGYDKRLGLLMARMPKGAFHSKGRIDGIPID